MKHGLKFDDITLFDLNKMYVDGTISEKNGSVLYKHIIQGALEDTGNKTGVIGKEEAERVGDRLDTMKEIWKDMADDRGGGSLGDIINEFCESPEKKQEFEQAVEGSRITGKSAVDIYRAIRLAKHPEFKAIYGAVYIAGRNVERRADDKRDDASADPLERMMEPDGQQRLTLRQANQVLNKSDLLKALNIPPGSPMEDEIERLLVSVQTSADFINLAKDKPQFSCASAVALSMALTASPTMEMETQRIKQRSDIQLASQAYTRESWQTAIDQMSRLDMVA